MSTAIFQNKIVLDILEKYKAIWSIEHALGVLKWDVETYMPESGVEERSISVSQLNLLKQKLILDPDLISLVDKADEISDLNDFERGVVRVLKRTIKIYKSIPPKLLEEFSRVTQESVVIWRNARAKNEFKIFQPYLEKIVTISREIAEYLGYKEHPYDALLDLYEEGLTSREVSSIFNSIVPTTKKVLENVIERGNYPQKHPLEDITYNIDNMRNVTKEIATILGYDPKRFRIDTSTHPFTIGIGIKDVRITTRYEGKDFKSALFSLIHEYGHALYQLQNDETFIVTPLAGGASLGIHESQSRFWENIIGRSKQFSKAVYPILAKHLDFLAKFSVDDLYLYFNTVRPSLIRVDADEITYNLHILVRFEIERLLLNGEIKVSDVSELWNENMEKYIGIKPKTYSEGVLQDIHWSQGSVGYFPTYTIGNIVAAQLRAHMLKDIPDLHDQITNLKFMSIKEWLRNKIHKWGSTYPPKDLLRKAVGEEINPQYFLQYLEEKYSKPSYSL
ncbi:MAG: carboxypeptidase M32 [Thermoprotei archaeon]